jgi:hypothetical protein
MTVRDLLSRMDSAELSEWLAYDRIEPLPDAHWDAALIAHTTARSMGAKKAKFENFLPQKPGGKTPRQGGAEMLSIVRRAVASAERRKGS